MDSWSGLGKIINDVKRKFEEYDLDELAESHLAAKDHRDSVQRPSWYQAAFCHWLEQSGGRKICSYPVGPIFSLGSQARLVPELDGAHVEGTRSS